MAYNYEQRWFCTDHAVEQYISRWFPAKRFAEAKAEILALLSTAKKVDQSLCGDPIFVSPEAEKIRFVIKDATVCITVLPESKGNISFMGEEELEDTSDTFGAVVSIRDERIAFLEKEIAELDVQRKELGKQKEAAHNELQSLKTKKKYGVD